MNKEEAEQFRTEPNNLRQENQQLKEQLKQRDEVIDKTKIKISELMSKYFYEKDFYIEDTHLDNLLQILDKYKGDSNESVSSM